MDVKVTTYIMPTPEAQKAFQLAASLLVHKNYYSMTQAFIETILNMEGVDDVVFYEVFGGQEAAPNGSSPKNLFMRRFPLYLSDPGVDNNTQHLIPLLEDSLVGRQVDVEGESPWYILDVAEDVEPRRVIIIKGQLSGLVRDWIDGIFSIYANQVAVLDAKERDVLTHLLNRQSFSMTLGLVMDFYRTAQLPDTTKVSWIDILDIDYFKSVNDRFGHLYGDEVLLHFSTLMEKTFHYSDFLFRYGGEEFVVILNRKDHDQVREVLEKFRESVATYIFPSGRLTVSIGYSRVDLEKAPHRMMEEADNALYYAKEHGRNLVVYHGDIKQTQSDEGEVQLF